MQIRLPESQRSRRRSPGGALASVTLHAALIALAVVATAQGRDAAAARPETTPVVYRTMPAEPAPPVSSPSARGGAMGAPRPAERRVAPPLTVPGELPPIALPSTGEIVVGVRVPGPSFDGPGVAPPGDVGPGLASGDGPLPAHLVDRAAAPRVVVTPRYPESLRARGLEGEVVARYVVDSTGRVRDGSVEIVAATNDLFADAVRQALARTRFVPAEHAGRPVAQLVEQRFEFRIGEREP